MALDYTDLSVCITVDTKNGNIDPALYLDCGEDYEKLNYKRFCLALDIDGEYLKDKSALKLKEIFHRECAARFGNGAEGETEMAVVLSSLFDYTEQGVNGKYFITHDSRVTDQS